MYCKREKTCYFQDSKICTFRCGVLERLPSVAAMCLVHRVKAGCLDQALRHCFLQNMIEVTKCIFSLSVYTISCYYSNLGRLRCK